MNNFPIGIFDSGVGGLSVWIEIDKLLPCESVVYFADNANCPYGEKSQNAVIAHSEKAVRFLIEKQCKLIVIACNTATSMAVDFIRNTFDIPVIGIVPAIKPAAINSMTGVIAILATKGTLNSRKFNETKREFSKNTEIISFDANDLVEIVENGLQGTEQAENVLRKYLLPMLQKNVDRLVLGCTHFPFLIDDIKKITGDSIILDNPAPAIAKRTEYIIHREGIAAMSGNVRQISFYSSGNIDTLKKMVKNIKNENTLLFSQLK
ncbi:MAG: glutamate racemase [Prevotellaceae bacterium]|jgi:glutamate racemase|nr:glutamate racemase [Prevotellaceae bacterium]